jgi:hypothetical protein
MQAGAKNEMTVEQSAAASKKREKIFAHRLVSGRARASPSRFEERFRRGAETGTRGRVPSPGLLSHIAILDLWLYPEVSLATPPLPPAAPSTAITSISTRDFFGKAATWTVDLAGGSFLKWDP